MPAPSLRPFDAFQIIAVTDGLISRLHVVEQMELLARLRSSLRPDAIIFRDHGATDYELMARTFLERTARLLEPAPSLSLHTDVAAARRLGLRRIHLPLPALRSPEAQAARSEFEVITSSVHSTAEAQEALALGATALIAGHIFATDCKKGAPPRGLDFLKEIVALAGSTPVYAIGGIKLQRALLAQLAEAGAKGACIRSQYMKL